MTMPCSLRERHRFRSSGPREVKKNVSKNLDHLQKIGKESRILGQKIPPTEGF